MTRCQAVCCALGKTMSRTSTTLTMSWRCSQRDGDRHASSPDRALAQELVQRPQGHQGYQERRLPAVSTTVALKPLCRAQQQCSVGRSFCTISAGCSNSGTPGKSLPKFARRKGLFQGFRRIGLTQHPRVPQFLPPICL